MVSSNTGESGVSNTVLLAGQKYASPVMDCLGNSAIYVLVRADQVGIIRIYQGGDAAHVTDMVSTTTTLADVGKALTSFAAGKYCKIEFENTSGSPMTYTRVFWKLVNVKAGVQK